MATTAEIYAQARKDAAANELNSMYSNLENAYNQQVQAAQASTQNTLNQLTQAAQTYQQNYQDDARAAYINKMQNDLTLNNELGRLGLVNSGYGVTQKLGNEANYGNALTGLQKNLATNLTNLDLKRGDANVGLQQTLADLAGNYASNRNSTSQYIANYLQDVYNNAYAQKYQEEQDALANQLAMAKAYSGGYSTSGGSRSTKSSSSSVSEESGTQIQNKTSKGMYVPGKTVKNFLDKVRILKTNDQKQNMISLALARGEITDNDVDYILQQLSM